MKLFRLFLLLLVLSLAGVAVTQYLRKSAGTEIALEQPAAPAAKSLGSGSDAPVARSVTRNAYSQNVDVASSVSIVSSVISALGALVSAFFSWARYRRTARAR